MAQPVRRPRRRRSAADTGVKRRWLWLLVPLLFPAAALISFYATNAAEITILDLLPTFGQYFLGVVAVTAVLFVVLRDVPRTVTLASLLAVAFFYYGYLYRPFARVSVSVGSFTVGPDAILWVTIAVVLTALTVLVFRTRERTSLAAKTLAVVGLSLALTSTALAVTARLSLDQSAAQEASAESPEEPGGYAAAASSSETASDVSTSQAAAATSSATASGWAGQPAAPQSRDERAPDIFFIVLDGYASNSSIAEFSGYDNSEFTGFLERSGFYVAGDAKANYSTTFLSLASTLNMKYLSDELEGLSGRNRAEFYGMVKQNRVVKKLKRKGYRYVHIASGWGSTKSAPLADKVLQVGGDEVDIAVNDATMFRPFNDRSLSKKKYRAVRKAFEHLDSIKSSSKRPTFVFAHILAPHGPYVFSANGKFATGSSTDMTNWRAQQKDNYIAQMQAINAMTERFVADRRKTSKRPLIIIIQGDHGTSFRTKDRSLGWLRRHSVLNAIYFSEGVPSVLYPSISPVNTFRVVLNEAIGAHYDPIPDRSYNSLNYSRPYELSNVTEALKKAEAAH